MAMRHSRVSRLKPFLDKVPPGFLVDSGWLKAHGIESKSIHRYVSRGWLERVIRGVYRRPLPEGVERASEVSWESVLLSLQRILAHDVHLGGESALELAGYCHYLKLGASQRVHLYGAAPAWLKRLPTQARIVVHRRSLFGDDPAGIGDSDRDAQESRRAVNVWSWPIVASSPERAILEALDELRSGAGFDNLDKIFGSLTMLRPKRLMALLAVCHSVKVRRLFFVFADRHGHSWRKHLDASAVDFGSGPRALVSGGKIHPAYRIYVPGHFIPGSDERSSTGPGTANQPTAQRHQLTDGAK